MRILFLSDVYSTPLAPRRGVGNRRVVHALRKHADVKVMSSVPWYPAMVAARAPQLKALIDLPAQETESDGAALSHPRRLHVPRVFALQAILYAASLAMPLRREVLRWRPDVLLSAWAYPDATAAVALAKLLGLPSIVRVMGSDINDYAQRPYRRPQIALAMRHADRVIAVSQALADEVGALGVSRENIAVIPTGVDVAKFHAVPREQARKSLDLPSHRLIVVPSRLSPEKGIRFLIEAVANLDEDIHAVLVGDGAEETSLRQQVQRLGLEQRVHCNLLLAEDFLLDLALLCQEPLLSSERGLLFAHVACLVVLPLGQ